MAASSFFVHELGHLMQLALGGRIAVQKHFLQPHRAERFRHRVDQGAVFARNNFRAAAADIDHQHPFPGLRPAAHHALVNQARLFSPGDDFDLRAQRGGGARQEFGGLEASRTALVATARTPTTSSFR